MSATLGVSSRTTWAVLVVATAILGCSTNPASTPPPLPSVSAFTAFVVGTDVHLRWTNPAHAALVGVRVQRRGDAFPASPSEGTPVYDGLSEAYTDPGLAPGTYYYAAFAHDSVPNYAAAATTKVIVASSNSSVPWASLGQVSAAWFHDRLWAFAAAGDASAAPGYVWSSVDGASWSTVTSVAPWGAYAGHAIAVLGDRLWVFGGVGQWDGATRVGKSVWWSPDGATWTLATDAAPLEGALVAVHAGQLWIVSRSAVHASSDGASWLKVGGRVPWTTVHAAWSWQQKLWVAAVPAGGDGSVDFLWWSPDGATWTAVSGTYLPSAVAAGVYRGQAVLLPGRATPSNDLLFSVDGVSWKRPTASPPWSERSGEAAVFTDDRIWVLGGQAGGATLLDVWSFRDRLACEGSGTGNDPPALELRADSPRGDAPHQVLLVADAADPNCDRLSFAWDFGDGTTGTDRLATQHVYAANGSYTATVTVSDGQLTATDSVTIEVAPQPQASVSIGATGGSVSIANAVVTVPPIDGLPESPFTLTQLPSNAAGAASMLPPDRFVLIGSSYRLDTPVSSAAPLVVTLGWSDADIPAGYDPANLAVVFRDVSRIEAAPSIGPSDQPGLRATYVALPVAVDLAAHTASFELHGRDEFQLAAVSGPLPVYTEAGLLPSGLRSALAAASPDRVQVVFDQDPQDLGKEIFKAAALSGFYAADEYAKAQGFVVVPEMITIVVTDLNALGAVNPDHRWRIKLGKSFTDIDYISKVTAHEYFHTVQAVASNHVSNLILNRDDWWWEGTASWFMDQVPQLDPIAGKYHATTLDRLAVPLNAWKTEWNDNDYQTVGFWKWLEAKNPGAMLRIMNRRLLAKRDLQVGLTVWFKDNNDATLQLAYVIPELANPDTGVALDYLDFAQDVLHKKDFDTSETADGELWGSTPQLGKPGAPNVVEAGEPGTADQKATIHYGLAQHLSILARVHYGVDDNGPLHVQFAQTEPDQHYKALVRIYLASDPSTVTAEAGVDDLSAPSTRLDFGMFDSTMGALVIVVDPQWSDPAMATDGDGNVTGPAPARTGTYQIWQDGPNGQCGPNETMCPSGCANVRTDPNNCGFCGLSCGGATCVDFNCVCPPGLTWCGADGCVDVMNDRANCGSCQTGCGNGSTCKDGTCICPEGQTWCGSDRGCADLMSDMENCGYCNQSCTGAVACVGGTCRCADPKLTWCLYVGENDEPGCVDAQTDERNCGRCYNACIARCPGAPSACFYGTCVVNPDYWCGECGHTCSKNEWCGQVAGFWECLPCCCGQSRMCDGTPWRCCSGCFTNPQDGKQYCAN